MKSRLKSEKRPRPVNHLSLTQITELGILKMAANKQVFVEGFGDRYARMRNLSRKLSRRGLLEVVAEYQNGKYYSITNVGRSELVSMELKAEFRKLAKA